MNVVGELVDGDKVVETPVSKQEKLIQGDEKPSKVDGLEQNSPDARPSHVSFLLDGDKVTNARSASSDTPPLNSSTEETNSGITSQEQLTHNQVVSAPCQGSLQNVEEIGTTELAALAHEDQADTASADTETMVELQQSRSLPEAITLLSKTTEELESRVNALLAQHEEEFFAAFRSHMAKVQKHVENLQACADEQKNLLERDMRIKTLQRELQWFVNEAVRLDQVCKKLKGELHSWRARTDALREDRDFLEAELKKAKRKLRSGQTQGPRKLCNSLQGWTEVEGSAVPSPKATDPPAVVQKAAPTVPSISSCQLDLKSMAHTSSDNPDVLRGIIEGLKKQVSCLAAANRRLQNEAKQNSRNKSSLVEASKALSRRRDLESFFLECINDVRKERKLRGAPSSLGEFEGLSLEEFLAFDRRKVLNALLSNDQVLQKLYSLVFPQRGVLS